ncbi:MAG: bis(5'-nucleosyl)-tetraphosphatase (symmetrical) YqeK [Dehalococcoidia bacterium]|nr:bis(5'-nucleosyl)-tetraphosphatase (symmetrical) YqeK [Dehalococcoidia bacterium]
MPKTLRKQIRAVREEMRSRPPGLRAHVERVLEEALDLADRHDADRERVELATVGHDLFRAHAPAKLLKLAKEAGILVSEWDERSPVMLHGPLAAVVLRERFGVDDDEVLAAVRDHTTGSPEMPLIARIILVADKIERRKRKRAPQLPDIRRLARRDLDTAMLCWADYKWVEERERGWDSYPAHWEARVRWVAEHHADIGLPPRTDDFPDELGLATGL